MARPRLSSSYKNIGGSAAGIAALALIGMAAASGGPGSGSGVKDPDWGKATGQQVQAIYGVLGSGHMIFDLLEPWHIGDKCKVEAIPVGVSEFHHFVIGGPRGGINVYQNPYIFTIDDGPWWSVNCVFMHNGQIS